MSRNPRDLDYVEAAALLLPRRGGLGSPDIQPWEPWTRPPERRAIDDEVARQIERRDQRAKAPHMRTRAELDAIGIRCPYVHARKAVAMAAGDGLHDRLANEGAKSTSLGTSHVDRLDAYAKAASDLIEPIETLLKLGLIEGLSRGLGFYPKPAGARRDHAQANARLRKVHDAQDLISAVPAALRILEAAAMENRKQLVPHYGAGDIWRQSFVKRIGIAWRSLTGRDPPKNSDYFREFVAAGFNSLGGPQTRGYEWKENVRTAWDHMAERPEWDRWDREERRTLPPGVTVGTAEQYRERQRQREERRTADICALLDAATSEEREAARMRLVEHWSWFPNTPEGQRDIAHIQAARGPKH